MLTVSVAAVPISASAQAVRPTAIVEAWIDARAAHDVDRAVALLDDDAYLLFTDFPDGGITIYEGKAEIREVLQSYEGADFQINVTETPSLINGTVIWSEEQASAGIRMLGVSSLEFFGEALIEDGKIRSMIYSLTPEAVDALAAAGHLVGDSADPGMPRSGGLGIEAYHWVLAGAVLSAVLGMFAGLLTHRRVYSGNVL